MSDIVRAGGRDRSTTFMVGEVVDLADRLARDEAGSLTALAEVRSEVIGPAMAGRTHRFVEAPRDAILIWFEQPADAVLCAGELQRLAGLRNGRAVARGADIVFRLAVGMLGGDGGDPADQGLERALAMLASCEPGGLIVSPRIADALGSAGPLPRGLARQDGTVIVPASAITLLPEPTKRRTSSWWQESEGPTQAVSPGTRLNDTYALDALIASGGMGEIFRGHEIHSDGTVAVKVIRSHLSGDETVLALFQKEASILKQIFNEGIVRYYAFSYDAVVRRYYLAMEFVEGTPLSDLIRERRLSADELASLRRRVSGALRVAHDRGIIHRDISPDNIVVPDRDLARAKIIDFGIARSTAVGAGTIIGTGFAGKYAYASPEQLGLNGGEVTGRSDVYSMGLVLAEAATGQRIDMGGREADVLAKRCSVPDLSAVDASVRPLITAMLQPDPALRPDMAAVEQWKPGTALPKPGRGSTVRQPEWRQASTPRNGRKAVFVGLGAAVLLAGVGAVGFLGLAPVPHDVPEAPELQADVPPRPAPTPEPAPTPTPAPAPAPAPTPTPAPVPTETKASKVRAAVAAFNEDACSFAHLATLREDAAGIEGFGRSRDRLERLDKAISDSAGFSPDITGHIVWSGQCAALDFVRRLDGAGADPPSLFLRRTVLHKGQSLAGAIEGAGTQSVTLLRVARDGTLTNLTADLQKHADAWNFDVPVTEDGGPYPNLMIALVSPAPLDLGQRSGPADQVFADLAKLPGPVRAAVKLVLIGN